MNKRTLDQLKWEQSNLKRDIGYIDRRIQEATTALADLRTTLACIDAILDAEGVAAVDEIGETKRGEKS